MKENSTVLNTETLNNAAANQQAARKEASPRGRSAVVVSLSNAQKSVDAEKIDLLINNDCSVCGTCCISSVI